MSATDMTALPTDATPEDDEMLARILQEQENAFMIVASRSVSSRYLSDRGSTPGGNEEGEVDDEELARQIQLEENREALARLAELTGLSPEDFEDYEPREELDPDAMSYERLQALGEAVGTVSKGLPAEKLTKCPLRAYGELIAGNAPFSGEDMCSICRVDFDQDDDVRTLPCGHTYHDHCIMHWFTMNKVCCVCNREVD